MEIDLSKAEIILLLEALVDLEPSDKYVRLYGHPESTIIPPLVKKLQKGI